MERDDQIQRLGRIYLAEQRKIEDLAKLLCWEKKYKEGDIAIWREKDTAESCRRKSANMCGSRNANNVCKESKLVCVRGKSALMPRTTTLGVMLMPMEKYARPCPCGTCRCQVILEKLALLQEAAQQNMSCRSQALILEKLALLQEAAQQNMSSTQDVLKELALMKVDQKLSFWWTSALAIGLAGIAWFADFPPFNDFLSELRNLELRRIVNTIWQQFKSKLGF